MLKRLAIPILGLFLYSTASAQVASPSLDPVNQNLFPTATGFNDMNSIGLQSSNSEGEGDMSINGVDLENGGSFKQGNSSPGAVAKFVGDGINADINHFTDVTTEFTVDLSDFGQGELTDSLKTSYSELNVGFMFSENFSLGIGYLDRKVKGDEQLSGVDIESENTSQETSAGINLKLGKLINLAGGVRQINFSRTETYVASSTEVEYDSVTYSENYFGVSLTAGDREKAAFRLEYSVSSAPETVLENETFGTFYTIQRRDQTNASLEFRKNNFLLAYNISTDKSEAAPDNNDDGTADSPEIIFSTTKIGLGWVEKDNFSVSIYQLQTKVELNDDDTNNVLNGDGFQANIALLF